MGLETLIWSTKGTNQLNKGPNTSRDTKKRCSTLKSAVEAAEKHNKRASN